MNDGTKFNIKHLFKKKKEKKKEQKGAQDLQQSRQGPVERGGLRTTQAASISTTRCIPELSPGSHYSQKRLCSRPLSKPQHAAQFTKYRTTCNVSRYFISNYTNYRENLGNEPFTLISEYIFPPLSHFLTIDTFIHPPFISHVNSK